MGYLKFSCKKLQDPLQGPRTRSLFHLVASSSILSQPPQVNGIFHSKKCQAEELQIALEESEKMLEEFQAFSEKILNPFNQRPRAEKLIFYLSTHLKEKANQIENLRMISLHRSTKRRFIYQNIKEKSDIGENLQEIDLLRCDIVNKEELAKLIHLTSYFSKMKEKDQAIYKVMRTLKNQIVQHHNDMEKLKKVQDCQEKFSRSLEARIKKCKETRDKEAVLVGEMELWKGRNLPSVEEYIQLSRAMAGLQKKVSLWQTKVSTMERLVQLKSKSGKLISRDQDDPEYPP